MGLKKRPKDMGAVTRIANEFYGKRLGNGCDEYVARVCFHLHDSGYHISNVMRLGARYCYKYGYSESDAIDRLTSILDDGRGSW